MKLNLVWEDCQNKIKVTDSEINIITQAIEEALSYEDFEYDTEINLMFTDNDGIREINNEQRNIDRATDVLSFPMLEQEEDGGIVIYDEDFIDGRVLLGDIVISLERAEEQANEYGHSFSREIGFLAVHSVLHLLGYDHELGEAEEKEMFSKQEEILKNIGLTR
ncbi:MAG: rRNA maturation RNase YbeY [Clostridia bacterium]|nr:rRNA maturation RNase YbeY [Clostridia bacterium]